MPKPVFNDDAQHFEIDRFCQAVVGAKLSSREFAVTAGALRQENEWHLGVIGPR
jgi:hypothetical protein